MCLWKVSLESKIMPSHLIVGDGIITVVGIVFVAWRVTGVSIADQGGGKGLGLVVISAGFRSLFRHEW